MRSFLTDHDHELQLLERRGPAAGARWDPDRRAGGGRFQVRTRLTHSGATCLLQSDLCFPTEPESPFIQVQCTAHFWSGCGLGAIQLAAQLWSSLVT